MATFRPKTMPRWRYYVPKLVSAMQEGYRFATLRADAFAGLTVAIVALPLAMALAIASGTTPDKGLITAIVAGFLISALGGSRFQIGGPTGAFVVVVYNVIDKFGYDGLIVATLMAGVMLVIAGIAGLGLVIKYMPQPVITGFTAGIAVIIFSSQVGEFLGLKTGKLPGDVIAKWQVFIDTLHTFDWATAAIAACSLLMIVFARRYAPKLPGFLFAVLAATLAAAAFHLPVETIGSRFGALPATIPMPHWPHVDLARVKELIPSAFTIAFLAGIESLLSAVVADAMTGRHHRSNCELVAQGIANCASALVGGLPATGAIARTVTNIRSHAQTPIAGMLHAVFLLVFMLTLSPLIAYVPLASLAAVLMIVAWNMSEIERVRYLLKATWGDRMTLLATFLLTVTVDLTVAIQVGIVMAAVLFMARMAEVFNIEMQVNFFEKDQDDFSAAAKDSTVRQNLPRGTEMMQIRGPFFFGVASRLLDALDDTSAGIIKVYILDLSFVPLIDASGAHTLNEFMLRVRRKGGVVLMFGLQGQPLTMIDRMQINSAHEHVELLETLEQTRQRAVDIVKSAKTV